MTLVTVRDAIKSLGRWYQTFEIEGYVTTSRDISGKTFWDRILPLVPPMKGKMALDLGCNAGYMAFKLADLGATVLGVDKSPEFLEQARFCARYFDPSGRVTFIQQDAEDKPISGQFKLILALSILYHFKNTKRAFQSADFNYAIVRTRDRKMPKKQLDSLMSQFCAFPVRSVEDVPGREIYLYRRPYLVVIISASASGQSLLSSFLDAHPSMLFSRELQLPLVFKKRGNITLQNLISMVRKNSEFYTKYGRPHYATGLKHEVPGMFNGRTEGPVLAFGDKNGMVVSSCLLASSFDFLSQLESLGTEVKFIVLRRDLETHKEAFVEGWSRGHGGRERAASIWARVVDRRERAISHIKKRGYEPLEVTYESLATQTGPTLRSILSFLEVDEPDGYIDACSSIIIYPCPVIENLKPGKWINCLERWEVDG